MVAFEQRICIKLYLGEILFSVEVVSLLVGIYVLQLDMRFCQCKNC